MIFKKRPSNNIFLKITSGESVKVVFRGDVFDFYQHWSGNKASLCRGDACSLCKEGKKKSFRFRLNCVVSESGAYQSKIFEGGGQTYDVLQSLAEEGVDLEKTVMKITRQGDGRNTKYLLTAIPGNVDYQLFKDLPLHDVTKFNDGNEDADDVEDQTGFDHGGAIPF